MYVIDVIPIARGAFTDRLSYWSPKDISAGNIISIPLQSRTISGIVLSSRPAHEIKSEVKRLPFNLKKITAFTSHPLLLQSFVDAAKLTADYYAGTIGSVISAGVPRTIIDACLGKEKTSSRAYGATKTPSEIHSHAGIKAIQAPQEERFLTYKKFIRENFAKGRSVYICFPTTHEAVESEHSLSKGIEEHTVSIHSDLSPKEMRTFWKKAVAHKHPLLLIGTGISLSVPRRDIGLIILDHESSRFYRSAIRPHHSIRTFVEYFTQNLNTELIIGDSMLTIESLLRCKNGEIETLLPFTFHPQGPEHVTLVDMRKEKEETGIFSILSSKVISLITSTIKERKRIFLFSLRRGLSPITICRDCGNAVLCKQCEAPVTLHQKTTGNIFLCHRCGTKRDAEERCVHCSSWRLEPLGSGSERVEEEIKKVFPEVPLFRLDKETADTKEKSEKILTQFNTTPGSILLGTEMALASLPDAIENTVVVSLDSLFAIPDLTINERIFRLLLSLREHTKDHFIVQTRNIETPLFEHALKGNIADFYKDEIEGRRELAYPPFSIVIKITATGPKEKIGREMKLLEKKLAQYKPSLFPAFIPFEKGAYHLHLLLTVDTKTWPDAKLSAFLSSLPHHIDFQVNPESLI